MSSRRVTPVARDVWNKLRVDLYRRLMPKIQEQDQRSGQHGYVVHWDDPDARWDEARNPNADPLKTSWDAIGLSPLIQEMFFALETMAVEDLAALESLDDLTDPFRCPQVALAQLAASFGYSLDGTISEDAQRQAVAALFEAYKAIGTFIGFKVFYRMVGFEVINVFQLWKKNLHEEGDDYSRTRYATTAITAQPIGPSGTQEFAGSLPDAPIVPGTLRITDGTVVLRDDEAGGLLGVTEGAAGTIDYNTGAYRIDLGAPAAANVTAAYDRITEEWPFHAARIDIELNLTPGGGEIPLIDAESIRGILGRLDEIRPLHVLVRNMALVASLDDTFTPGATDSIACAQVRLDHRDPIPSDASSLGRDFAHLLDQAPRAEDEFRIEQLNGGGTTTLVEHVFEDRAAIVCPLDRLIIETPGSGNPPMHV